MDDLKLFVSCLCGLAADSRAIIAVCAINLSVDVAVLQGLISVLSVKLRWKLFQTSIGKSKRIAGGVLCAF